MLTSAFADTLSIKDIILRIVMAIILGGMIGYERGRHNNRPAGFRTHILVCLGAAIVSLTQDQLRVNIFEHADKHGIIAQVLKTDLGRMGAQVVSGIGFLGAGTIMRDKGMVGGLTTAASIWATGCLGLGIGWGFYSVVIPCGVAIIIVLVTLKQLERSLIENKCIIKIDVKFKEDTNFSKNLLEVYNVFENMNIKIKDLKKNSDENKIYYKVVASKQINTMNILKEISDLDFVTYVYIP